MKRANQLFTIILLILCIFSLVSTDAHSTYYLEGQLDAQSETWNRVKDTPPATPATCGIDSDDSYNNGVGFAEFHIVPDSTTVLQAEIDPAGSTFDTMLAIYCAPFDPANPADNLMAMDDDSNGYPHASLSARNISLTAGQDYYLVVSTYSTYTPYGSYRLTLGDDISHRHGLDDVILGLQVLAGQSPAASRLNTLFDTREEGWIQLSSIIEVMVEVSTND